MNFLHGIHRGIGDIDDFDVTAGVIPVMPGGADIQMFGGA